MALSVKRGVKRALGRVARPFAVRYRTLSAETTRGANEAAHVNQRLDELAEQVRIDVEVIGEFSRVARRILEDFSMRAGDPAVGLEPSDIEEAVLRDEHVRDRVMRRLRDRPLAELTPGEAEYLAWAEGEEGFRAQAGVFFTEPVLIGYEHGSCYVAWITERVVEVPFVYTSLTSVPAGARVLDVGSRFSTVSVSLASMGYRVTALDLEPYPLEHPNLEIVTSPIESWDGPGEPFDVVVAVSTVEHLGLGHYGDEAGRDDLDRQAMKTMKSWLKPDGMLVLTVPFGEWSVDHFQRVYDFEHLDELLDGWSRRSERFLVQTDRRSPWQPFDPRSSTPWPKGGRGVALVTATPA